MSDAHNQRPQVRERTSDLKEDAAPDPVGVYERPERSGPAASTIAIMVLVLVLVAAIAVYMLWL